MNLADMKPKESKLKISTIKQELTLRPITLADEAWLDSEYGADEIQKIFTDVKIVEISRIVFRLLEIESKKLFKKQKVDFVTEDGDVKEVELGGVELLKRACVGWDDKMALIQALIDNLNISRPEQKETSKKKRSRKRNGNELA